MEKYNDFKKRKNLTFDTRDDRHRRAYDKIENLNRNATNYIVDLILNISERECNLKRDLEDKNEEILLLKQERKEILLKILNKLENVEIKHSNINTNIQDEDVPNNIIDFIKGFQV